VLTREEIDALLGGIAFTEPKYMGSDKEVRFYDFKRPDKYTKDHLDAFNIIHKELAGRLTEFFSGYLKSMVNVRVQSIDQVIYGEFIRSVYSSSFVSIINLHPLKGSAVIKIDQAGYARMLDILFGGHGNYKYSNTGLTSLEKFVMEKLIVRSFDAICGPWKKIIDFTPELTTIKTIPEDVKLLPPDEMAVLVTFECKINNRTSSISILYPYCVINPIKNRITSQYYNSGVETMSEPIESDMDQMSIPVSVIMDEKNFPLKTIKELEVGTILELDKPIDRDMDIYAGDVIIACGEVVVIDDKFGIRITETGKNFLNGRHA
jgi:flagellar motor switch protein FliM